MGAVVNSTAVSRQEAEVKADVYDKRLVSAQQVVSQLKGGIASLFNAAVSQHMRGGIASVNALVDAWTFRWHPLNCS